MEHDKTKHRRTKQSNSNDQYRLYSLPVNNEADEDEEDTGYDNQDDGIIAKAIITAAS